MKVEKEKNIDIIFSSIFLKGESFQRKEEIRRLLTQKREEQRLKIKRRRRIQYGMVASVAIVMGIVGLLLYNNVELETEQQRLMVHLPDGSEVELMEHSCLHYNRLMWNFSRDLSLSGEALFSVAKGETFTVATLVGNVSVLGTKFKVMQQGEEMRVDCVEGSVKVELKSGDNKTLQPGESAECTPQSIAFIPSEPLPEYLIYNQAALTEVLEKMEDIYQVSIASEEDFQHILYTGGVSTTNLEEALEVVLGSCGLSYQIEGGNNIKIKRKK